MDKRDWIAVVALGCDLVGGFLLSLPLVWNVEAAIQRLEQVMGWVRRIAVFFVVLGGVLAWGAVLGAGVVWILERLGHEVSWWRLDAPLVLAALTIWAVCALGLVLFAPVWLLERFLVWVKRGEREKQMGRTGFLVFFLGLILQGWLNLTSH